jgi:CDGSH-type Zn-finger protein
MAKVEILSSENGPNVVLVDGKAVVALCRCGQSKNKPRCDGSHHTAKFTAARAEVNVLP